MSLYHNLYKIYYYLLHLIPMNFQKRIPLPFLLTVTIILATGNFYAWNYWNYLDTDNTILSVSFLDVGQGDAIYIRAPNGNDILIDGGPDQGITHELTAVIPSFDTDIDLVIATHPDKDHIAGLITAFENYEVKKYLHSESSSGSSFDTSLKKHAADELNVQETMARRGQRFIIDDTHGVYLDILFPDQNTSTFKETNDASIVARLVYGQIAFMLTGDAPASVENFIVGQDKESLQSEVLKLGHHGSKTSTSDLFLETVKPDYAIVSAGKNNSYHHPNIDIVARVTQHNIPLLSTIEEGTIMFETDGTTLWRK